MCIRDRIHKIGDTLANLTFRLLFDDLGFTNDEIALYDVGVGFWAYLVGIFVGGFLYSRMGMKRSVLFSLVPVSYTHIDVYKRQPRPCAARGARRRRRV